MTLPEAAAADRIIRFPPERMGERLVHRAWPRSGMTCSFWAYMAHLVMAAEAPSSKRAEPPDVGSIMRNVAAVAFAEHFPLHMGWSQLAALNDGFAIGADQLRDVEATDAGLRETKHPE